MSAAATSSRLPDAACDCHVHLFGPASQYPFADDRVYTPPEAGETALNALHVRLGIARVVLVQPSVYGTDNRRLQDGLVRLNGLARPGAHARGIAVIADETGDAELAALHAAGVRGVRVNISTHGIHDPDEAWRSISAQGARVAPLGWHVQVLAKAAVVAAMAERIAGLPCPLVIDHFGQPDLAKGPDEAGFRAITDLLHAGLVRVKLSAMERLTGRGRLALLRPFIEALASANPQGIVWGSDWPHTGGGRGLGRNTSRAAGISNPSRIWMIRMPLGNPRYPD